METNSLNFENLQKALDVFIKDFIQTYKGLLIRDDKKASGDLLRSIKPIEIEFSNNKMSGSISLANYWKYIEYGTGPQHIPDKRQQYWPRIKKILKWIEKKPVLARPNNGIKPTNKQLAFLISRKIHDDGIKPGRQFAEALNLTWAKNSENISNAISLDLQEQINLIPIWKTLN